MFALGGGAGSGDEELPLFRRRAPRVPDPGQRVWIRTEQGSWRGGFRAISGPLTADNGEVIVLVAEKHEYRDAWLEDRSPIGIPLPVERVATARPSWWRFWS